MSRYSKASGIVISFFISLVISACTPKAVSNRTVVISYIGSVEITRGLEAARRVVLGEELKQGDSIKTGSASFLVFSIGETATARIQPDSSVTLTNIADMMNINLGLAKGGVLNRVNKLVKNGSYKVNTPTVVASVRGTVFSTYFEEGTNTVAVKNGNVDVAVKNSSKSVSLKEGSTAVIRDDVLERPIDDVESVVLDNMTSIPSEIDIDSSEKSQKLNEQIIEKDREINKQLEDKGAPVPKTLAEIKEKYERIDEVRLYSGKVIKGIIVERGNNYRILTTSGYITIPAKQIRNTKVIK